MEQLSLKVFQHFLAQIWGLQTWSVLVLVKCMCLNRGRISLSALDPVVVVCYSHKYQADALCLSRDIFICFWFSNRACFYVTYQAKAKFDCVSVQQRLNATVFNAISKRQISISKSRKTKQDKAKFDCASVQQRLNATVFNAISKKQIWISKSKAPSTLTFPLSARQLTFLCCPLKDQSMSVCPHWPLKITENHSQQMRAFYDSWVQRTYTIRLFLKSLT